MSGLRIHHLYKSFAETRAVAGVSFDVQRGEVVALLGPSGCGKSTILMLVAGLESPDSGEIDWNGKSLAHVPAHKRGFGLMFQDFALFPHMNVAKNVAFGLKMGRQEPDEIRARLAEVLELVGLPDFGDRDVHTLSGGEQQRVALARALAPAPRLLMLDEPLGSLDRNLRERLVLDLSRILRAAGQTAIYVTHDQEEAFAIADRVVLLNAGKVEQDAAPIEMYANPASPFVARFLGMRNLVPAELTFTQGGYRLDTAIGSFEIPAEITPQLASAARQAVKVCVLLRPDAVHLGRNGKCTLEGRLVGVSFRGSTVHADVEINAVPLRFDFTVRAKLPQPGDMLCLSFEAEEAFQIYLETCPAE